MTVPIYITAAILAVLFAYISDRVGKRSPFIIGFLFMMIVGFSMYVPSRFHTSPNFVADKLKVHIHVKPEGHLRWRIHRGVRHLPSFPGSYQLAEQQPRGLLQAQCWYGYSDRCRESWRGELSRYHGVTMRCANGATGYGIELLQSARRAALRPWPWAGVGIHFWRHRGGVSPSG